VLRSIDLIEFQLNAQELALLNQSSSNFRVVLLMATQTGVFLSTRLVQEKPCFAMLERRYLTQLRVNNMIVPEIKDRGYWVRKKADKSHPMDITKHVRRSLGKQSVGVTLAACEPMVGALALVHHHSVSDVMNRLQQNVLLEATRVNHCTLPPVSRVSRWD
jgi:hypothetical protein